MGLGIEFDGVNRHMKAPKGMTEEECYTLPVRIAEDTEISAPVSVSCWQMTNREIEEFKNNGGKVYLKVVGGQPAVNVTTLPYEGLDSSSYDQAKLNTNE